MSSCEPMTQRSEEYELGHKLYLHIEAWTKVVNKCKKHSSKLKLKTLRL